MQWPVKLIWNHNRLSQVPPVKGVGAIPGDQTQVQRDWR